MSTFTRQEVIDRASDHVEIRKAYNRQVTASSILNETVKAQKTDKEYHIFLAHSKLDELVILGTKLILEDLGYTVYVDWLEDPLLDRASVNARTVKILKERMESSQCLFYASSDNSTYSKWMPWECGYFDGLKGRCAILPLTIDGSDSFNGQEYLSIYPYVTKQMDVSYRRRLWVTKNGGDSISFDDWLRGFNP